MDHDLRMRSKVHPKHKTKYRVCNWPEYDRSLVQRGDITLWTSEDAVASWKPAPTGQRGAQRKFSDHAIESALTLRIIFKLPLRQAEGFLRSVLSLMALDLQAPDHTTLSRRSQHLNIQLGRVSTTKSIHLIIDSTGLSIVGEGEWAAARYGGRGRRGWKKLHLGVDRTGVIVAETLTDGDVNDAKTALDLIDRVEGGVVGRRRWKKESGYHQQAQVENTFFRYKSIIGDSGATSTDQNPIFEYTAAGTYTVSLTATNANGFDSLVRTDYIFVPEPAVLMQLAAGIFGLVGLNFHRRRR